MNSKKEIYENAPLAPLWRLQSKTKRFYTPIPIAVKAYRDEDFFFAENETLLFAVQEIHRKTLYRI